MVHHEHVIMVRILTFWNFFTLTLFYFMKSGISCLSCLIHKMSKRSEWTIIDDSLPNEGYFRWHVGAKVCSLNRRAKKHHDKISEMRIAFIQEVGAEDIMEVTLRNF